MRLTPQSASFNRLSLPCFLLALLSLPGPRRAMGRSRVPAGFFDQSARAVYAANTNSIYFCGGFEAELKIRDLASNLQ